MGNHPDSLELMGRQAWRSWLDANHQTASEAWLVINKKGSPLTGLSLEDAVEEALCYGWIDGTLNTRDENTYLLRFSPRRPGSVWSIRNIHRVEELERKGLLMEAGQEVVRIAKENGSWKEALDRENTDVIPLDLESALRRAKGALAAYRGLPKSRKQRYLYWLQSAKREETRKRRIQEIVDQVAAEG
jgi:uncharacterized protein YdeI (YjbR/CyaY-like superfamily)